MIDYKLHYYQKAILKKLVYKTGCKFSELVLDGLESEHMNYHLKLLIDYGLVLKVGNLYQLTDAGKDYSNLLDDEIDIVEKQPKTSVILEIVRKNPVTGVIEELVNKRLRHPYFGKVGRLTGKVRFGETLQEAAARELYEETGLKAENFKLRMIYHKMRKREDGTCVQDVLFYIFRLSGVSGELIEKTEFQENFWLSKKDVGRKDIDFYDDYKFHEDEEIDEIKFVESMGVANGF